MEYLECVTFLLLDGEKVLTEKRRDDKPLDPGLVAIPGGHVDPGETVEQALKREVMEELALTVDAFQYLCTLLHYARVHPSDKHIAEVQRIHYYLIDSWHGELQSLEAASLHWLPLSKAQSIDVEADRVALGELIRYRHLADKS